jgi:uncharacterized protein (TIGR00661 family)
MKKVLVAPLDWGLGHATRCIPIIRELLNRHCQVYIAGNGASLLLLKEEFPSLTFCALPGYNPVYHAGNKMVWAMGKQLPKFIRTIQREHKEIETLITQYNIDLVISDNRYGCWSEKITSVFISHQLNIIVPNVVKWTKPVIRMMTNKLIRKFSVCWIPDFPESDRSLAGDLVGDRKNLPMNATYVGPLSRFKWEEPGEIKYDIVSLLSGPEPQRSILEETIQYQLSKLSLRSFLVRGLPTESSCSRRHADFLNSKALQTVILQSSMVIARSGYSTILDLAALGKKAIFIPTPGQTEQEYLADRFDRKGIACKMLQENINIEQALVQSRGYNGFNMTSNNTNSLLTKALNNVL